VIPALQFQYDKYALCVSYDLNTSQLTGVSKSRGGLEFSLKFNTSPGYGKALGDLLILHPKKRLPKIKSNPEIWIYPVLTAIAFLSLPLFGFSSNGLPYAIILPPEI
jgi:hypothetical protein